MQLLEKLFFILFSFQILLKQSLGFFNPNQVVLSINCGSNNYVKDHNELVYSPDQYYSGGKTRNVNLTSIAKYTIYGEQYDWNIHQYERTTDDNSFTYSIPIKEPGNYSIIFLFADFESKNKGERVFNIYLDNYLIVPQLDIFDRAGGEKLPHAEIFEFTYKNDIIKQGITQEILMIFHNHKRQLQFTFSKIIGRPKVDAIILYQGFFNDLKMFLQQKLKQKGLIQRYLSDDELYNYLMQDFLKNKNTSNSILLFKSQYRRQAPIYQRARNVSNYHEQEQNYNYEENQFKQDKFILLSKQYQSVEQNTSSEDQESELEKSQKRQMQKLLKLKQNQEIWLFSKMKNYTIGFLNYIFANIIFFVCLGGSFACMIYCFRPSDQYANKDQYYTKKLREQNDDIFSQPNQTQNHQTQQQDSLIQQINENISIRKIKKKPN